MNKTKIKEVKLPEELIKSLELKIKSKNYWTPEIDEVIKRYGSSKCWLDISETIKKFYNVEINTTSITRRYKKLIGG